MAYSNIDKPNQYFNTVLYTGDGTTSQSVSGVGFQPDWIWIKRRDSSANHRLTDVVRGVSNKLESSTTGADTGSGIGSFDSDGWTFNATGAGFNALNGTYVGWNWLGANGTSANTDGSISSTVSANTTAGFSIVTTTGTGANGTIGHGLGTAPAMVIGKRRDSTGDWRIYNKNLTSNSYILFLNTTSAEQSGNSATWNDTAPTSSVFSVGTSGDVNASSGTFVFYCFSEVKGFSKFGSYTGNGSTDGTFVYTGFKPAWIMIKESSNALNSWHIRDNKRSPINVVDISLYANDSVNDVSASALDTDFLSNGFKIRNNDTNDNGSGRTYVYMAFAESPIVGSNLVPNNAR